MEENSTTKQCQFCGEAIHPDAIKCKHCGEFLNKKKINFKKRSLIFVGVVLVFIFILQNQVAFAYIKKIGSFFVKQFTNKDSAHNFFATSTQNSPVSSTEKIANTSSSISAQVKSLNSAPAKPLVVQGTTKIGYASFVPYVVKIVCTGGSGSGTIVSPGTILTNYHVIEGETECSIGFTTNVNEAPSQWEIGSVSGVDKSLDRAIIKVSGSLAKKTIKKCRASDTKISDDLVVIGYPGAGGNTITLTNGNISGFLDHYIKTSAKVNPGNSGGAAIHKSGCYLGIPSAANVKGIEALGLIVDERIGGAINDNDVGINQSGEAYKQEIQQKNADRALFDEFVTKIASIENIYDDHIASADLAANYSSNGLYSKCISKIDDINANLQNFTNRINHLNGFENFYDIGDVKAKLLNSVDNFSGYISWQSRICVDASEGKYQAVINDLDNMSPFSIYSSQYNSVKYLVGNIIQRGQTLFYSN